MPAVATPVLAGRVVNAIMQGATPVLRLVGDPDEYHRTVVYERINITPSRMGGLPCIRDTRVTVAAVLGQLAAGRTFEQILDDYPYLVRQDILAALDVSSR